MTFGSQMCISNYLEASSRAFFSITISLILSIVSFSDRLSIFLSSKRSFRMGLASELRTPNGCFLLILFEGPLVDATYIAFLVRVSRLDSAAAVRIY